MTAATSRLLNYRIVPPEPTFEPRRGGGMGSSHNVIEFPVRRLPTSAPTWLAGDPVEAEDAEFIRAEVISERPPSESLKKLFRDIRNIAK